MEVKIIGCEVGLWKENSYLVEYKGESWLIDPGDDFEQLENFFRPSRTVFKGIINTHGHFDHIGAVSDFAEKYSLPFFIHSKDKQLVRQGNLYKKIAGGTTVFKTPVITDSLDSKSFFPLDDKQIKIHHTPGHTHGSVCFEIDNNLISGDILFEEGFGRTDLPGGNKNLLYKSIEYLLGNFEGYKFFPGHGQPFILDANAIALFKKMLG